MTMNKLSPLTRKARWLAVLACIAIPFGLLAYTGGFASIPLPIDQPIGYVAQDDITSFDLTSNAEVIFRPEYNRQYWSGDLHAFPVSSAGLINTSVESWTGGSTPAAKLLGQNWDTGRFIGTMNDAGAGIAFRETSMGSTSFPAPPTISGNTYTRANLLAYLRGDSTNEGGGGMRPRASPLGDIVHSRPYFLNDDAYDTVFVGANDGMLHAFDATSGAERWAY
ncbi:MAG: PQQ-binding-like beta-propeller repeat protein, partial [Rhodoferax sp.]|nr:PQQ-binding-like beta-propeller repeat protein [Rhodoferax sp.]